MASVVVQQALISPGSGCMDAERKIEWIKPDIYAVKEDGDRPEKREFCAQHGLDYVVLTRRPKAGLPGAKARTCACFEDVTLRRATGENPANRLK